MASQSNVYPCSSSLSQLICHALTSLYSSLHILIFTPNTHTFVLRWNQLFNSNVPGRHELCTHSSSSLLCPTIHLPISRRGFLSFKKWLCNSPFLFKMQWLCEQWRYFHPWMQTNANLGVCRIYKAYCGRLPDRLTCVLWQTECPADSTECSRMYNPWYAVLLHWKPIRLA